MTETTPPTAICPDEILDVELDINGSGTLLANIGDGSSSDNCSLQAETSPSQSYGCGDIGTQTVVLTAIDSEGNTNTATCSFEVVDNIGPTLNCPTVVTQSNDAGVCEAMVTYSVTYGDNCAGATLSQTDASGLTSGDVFAVGTTVQSYEAQDANGNTNSCSFNVTVVDDEPPVINCPSGNVVRNTDPNTCQHVGVGTDLDPLPITDNCQVQTITNDYSNTNSLGGSTFSKGKTLVTWTVTDIYGNSTVCSYNVRIRDREAPVFDNCPDDTVITVPFASGGSYHTWPALTATDNCNNPNKITITGFPLSGSFFPVDTTPVAWTATDKANNVGDCVFKVIVEEEGEVVPNGASGQVIGTGVTSQTNWDTATHTLTILSSGGTLGSQSDNLATVCFTSNDPIIDFRARVTPGSASYYDQAGIMMRQGFAANAAHASLYLTGTHVPTMTFRAIAGSFPLSSSGTAVTIPYWLRLYRGATIQGFVSADGVSWTLIGTYPNTLTNPLELCLFAITTGNQAPAVFDNISINGVAQREGQQAFDHSFSIKAFPNPFDNALNLEISHAPLDKEIQIKLYNVLGQKIYEKEIEAVISEVQTEKLSLEGLAPGTYLLEAKVGLQRYTLKVIRQ